jgi:hypothetical protein
MGTGFDFWNWIQNWKLDFFFPDRIEHDGFQPTRSLASSMSGTKIGTKICEKKRRKKKVGGLLEVFLVPFMHGTRTVLIYYLQPKWRLFIKVKNCPITLKKTVLGNYPVWLVRPVESCSDL